MHSVTLVFKGEKHLVQAKEGQYFSLMSLITNHLFIPGFGLCSGMGSCGTCMVRMHGSKTLSCTIAVNDALDNVVI
jgi:aerobic-type carbon monoxide dehydrogenase small subunit (CoxS/CutS family)